MSSIKFNGQEWPVRFDFSAIKRTLPLFGLRYMTEIEKLEKMMAEEFPAEAIAPFIQAVVRSGLRYVQDERETPTVDDIERAIDEDMGLIGEAINAIAEKPAELPAEAKKLKAVGGKKKVPTSKP